MFDELRDSVRHLTSRLDPDERRRMSRGMREAMVQAKLAIHDLRTALAGTERFVRTEQAELETVRRRRGLAADIGDHETVTIAERFAAQHAERLAVLEQKRLVQQQELELAEREYASMSEELRRVMSGLAPDARGAEAAAAREVESLLADVADDPLAADVLEGPLPPRTRASREADADARLADLKRKLGR